MPESKEFETLSRQAFDEADSDKSGAVGFDEFLAWLRKDADLMRTLTYMEMKDLKMYVCVVAGGGSRGGGGGGGGVDGLS